MEHFGGAGSWERKTPAAAKVISEFPTSRHPHYFFIAAQNPRQISSLCTVNQDFCCCAAAALLAALAA
jgi:hypothetical protein